MNKRYQVFVSSTYEDLIEERLEVMKALLELDCIPCGMEYFPAANEDQWTFIKNLIDACDYYVVIIGGRYGSEAPEGKSYTQKEYEYALSKDIPTMGFIHHDRDSLPLEKKEDDKEKMLKLDEFITLVRSKLCKDWRNSYELGAVVSRSLTQLMKGNPRVGWVRSDKAGSEELLEEINNLRKSNQLLTEKLAQLEKETTVNVKETNIAFEEDIQLSGTHKYKRYDKYFDGEWDYKTSWKNVFRIISPYLMNWCNEETVQTQIATSILKEKGVGDFYSEKVDGDLLQTIKVQFLALGLIKVDRLSTVGGGTGLFWGLTQKGNITMLNERSIKK